MAKASIKLDILLGRSSKGGFDARENIVTSDIRARLQKVFQRQTFNLASDAAAKKVEAMEQEIVAALERDLTRFARTASAFFFSRNASERDQLIVPPRTFSPQQLLPSLSGRARAVTWQHIENDAQARPLEWPGLAKSTMIKKRRKGGPGSTTYFIENDVLRRVMGDAFGGIIEQLFAPSVTFTRTADRDPRTGRFIKGTSVGKITIRVFRSSADSGTFRPALASGDWRAAADDTSLLTRYLSVLTAAKLNNYARSGGHSRKSLKRPWVGPALAYWLIYNLPIVITQSVETAIKGSRSSG